jgi:hypothetical protein
LLLCEPMTYGAARRNRTATPPAKETPRLRFRSSRFNFGQLGGRLRQISLASFVNVSNPDFVKFDRDGAGEVASNIPAKPAERALRKLPNKTVRDIQLLQPFGLRVDGGFNQ